MKGLIATYLLTYGGALAALFDPFAGLLVYVCFSVIRPESLWPWSVSPGNYSRIVAVALLLGWLLKGCGRWDLRRSGAIVAALIGYWAWTLLGALLAPNQDVAWNRAEELTKVVLPFLVGITTIDSVHKLKQLAWVILISQGYVALEFNLSYLAGFNRLQELGFGGMDNNSNAIALDTCVGLGFFLGLATRDLRLKALAFGAAAAIGHAVLLSFSRGGMVGLIVIAVVAFLLIPKRPGHYAAFAVAVLLGLRLAGPQVAERFGTSFAKAEDRDDSSQSRLELWSACLKVMIEKPVLGLGPDHWPLMSAEYGFTKGKEAHSLWMQTGAEQGFPGVGSLLAFYVFCAGRLWSLTRERTPVPDPWVHDSARMVIASLTGFLVSSTFVSLKGLELPYYVVLIGAGALKLSSEEGRTAPPIDQDDPETTPAGPVTSDCPSLRRREWHPASSVCRGHLEHR
jgi:probable O-glycosylation ligase (exosortase A-associated)